MITREQAEAILAVSLMAALTDGRTSNEEREQIRSLFESLEAESALSGLPALYQKVLLKKTSLEDQVALLDSPEAKQMAFEMAVCVADADGRSNPAEQAFLDDLEKRLALNHDDAVAFERDAEAIAESSPMSPDEEVQDLLAPIPLEDSSLTTTPAPTPAPPSQADLALQQQARKQALAKEIDSTILKYSILNGALELLPQNLATMAILPLQTRMVYVIGKRHGHTLDAGHIKEFIATLGLGATSQMLENFARKALGKLAKKALGKTAGSLVKSATGPMMTFASTFAIGRVANAYYAGGRKLSNVDLKSLFNTELNRGKALYEQHRPQIDQSAKTINPSEILRAVRGGPSPV